MSPASLRVTTPPAVEPVGVAELKGHLRLDAGDTEEDAYLEGLIAAARLHAEAFTGRALITQEITARWDAIPAEIRLPMGDVQALGAVTYTDTAGQAQTLAADRYQADLSSIPARLRPAFGTSWPRARGGFAALSVAYTAGYGDGAEDVPAGLRQAILFLAAHWYEHREAVACAQMAAVPFGVTSLLWMHRIRELG